MDPSGKLIYTRNHEVLSGNIQTVQEESLADGTRIPFTVKEIGSTDIFATSLIHSPNGRFVTVVGDGEYIIYTALAWRNKSFGNGISFAWAPDSNTYAVLENKAKLKVFKNFKERSGSSMKGAGSWTVDGLHGGPLLGARGAGFVVFWDWETGDIVRRIDVEAKNVRRFTLHLRATIEKSACRCTGPYLAHWSQSSAMTPFILSALTATPTMQNLKRVTTLQTRV
jgi:coatomer subunit beta'